MYANQEYLGRFLRPRAHFRAKGVSLGIRARPDSADRPICIRVPH